MYKRQGKTEPLGGTATMGALLSALGGAGCLLLRSRPGLAHARLGSIPALPPAGTKRVILTTSTVGCLDKPVARLLCVKRHPWLVHLHQCQGPAFAPGDLAKPVGLHRGAGRRIQKMVGTAEMCIRDSFCVFKAASRFALA